jgi:hypothetical protein
LKTGSVLRFDVFTAVLLMIQEFWHLASSSSCFEGSCFFIWGQGIFHNTVVCKNVDNK